VDKPVDPDHLVDALRQRLPGAERHRALALTNARTVTERAWVLVGLGVALRQSRDYVGALRMLDAAVALGPGPRALRAAYLCALAVHTDRGDYDAARRISRSMPE
jgi:hypothetical protein